VLDVKYVDIKQNNEVVINGINNWYMGEVRGKC